MSALSERWSHTCRWTVEQLQRLEAREEEREQWRARLQRLERECAEREGALKRMEAEPARAVGELPPRVQELRRVRRALRALRADTDALLQLLQGEPALLDRADALADRLDALVMILHVQAQRVSPAHLSFIYYNNYYKLHYIFDNVQIEELGFEFDVDATENSETNPVESREPPPAAMNSTAAEGSAVHTSSISTSSTNTNKEESPSSKKPRLSDGKASSDFQVGYKVFESWADNAEKFLNDVSYGCFVKYILY